MSATIIDLDSARVRLRPQAAAHRQREEREHRAEQRERDKREGRAPGQQNRADLGSYADVRGLNGGARAALANRGISLEQALSMSDDELSFLSALSIARLRVYAVESARETYAAETWAPS